MTIRLVCRSLPFLGAMITSVNLLAWDSVKTSFPRQDTPYVQMVNDTSSNYFINGLLAKDLGYFPVNFPLNAFGTTPYLTTSPGGIPTGNPAPVRATLALMDDAEQSFPILFPDWDPGANWSPTSGKNIWLTNAGIQIGLQHQYELFMAVNTAALLTTAQLAASQAGVVSPVSYSAAPAPATSFPVSCGGFAQQLVLYSAYGNSTQSYVPQTLRDDGPLPAKDERAWPLPFDSCVH